MKKILVLFVSFFILSANVFAEDMTFLPSVNGLVQNVVYENADDNETIQTRQIAEVKLLNGDNKGETLLLENILTGNPAYDITLKKGSKVVLHVEQDENGMEYSISDVKRSDILVWLSFIFCGLLVFVGKRKGLFSLVAIVLTCLLIFYALTPLILFGINPVLATIILCIISTALTMYLVGGINRKSSSALLGTVLSLLFAGVLSLITVKVALLNGISGENALFLYSAHPQLNFVAILVSTMILATLGAVMDVAMSIASTINEIYTIDNTKTVKELFVSGMNVGKDIIGTMANTLILVYLGSSLPLLLLASNIDFQKFINLNQVVAEISSALIGSSAIVICVPLTAFVASQLVKNLPVKIDFSQLKE